VGLHNCVVNDTAKMSKSDNCAFANGQISPVQQMLSSSAGAMLVATLMTPLDVVKTRLQAQDRAHAKKCFLYSNGITDHLYLRLNGDPPPKAAQHTPEEICNCKWYNRPKYFNGTLDAFVKISKVEGVGSLWSGLSPSLALALPTTVLYLTSYEQLKSALTSRLQPDATKMSLVSLTSGAASRVLACTVVAPLELVRTKMQSQKMAFNEVRLAVGKSVGAEGVSSLWKGLTATIMRDVPFSAIYWPLYEALRPPEYDFNRCFLAGAASGTLASALTLPFDVIKTQRQLELGESLARSSSHAVQVPNNRDVVREIWQFHGVRGFWAGMTPRIMKVAPACAIMISSYEFFKQFFAKRNSERFSS